MIKSVLFLKYYFLSLSLLCCAACKNDHTANDGTSVAGQVRSPDTLEEVSDAGFYADYEGTNRVIWQKPEMVISLLGDLEDKTVADIGAGTGHFSRRLATKAKKVIAIDIDERFIHFLDSIRLRELPAAYQERLEPRLATPDDPKLADNEVDAALIVNTFMYIENRIEYLNTLAPAITSGGKLLIIDFKKMQTPIGPPVAIRLSADAVEQTLEETGFKNIQTDDSTLQYQYIVMAEK